VVEVKASIVMTGVIGLTLICICMVIFDHIDNTIVTAIVGAIAFAIGAIAVPSPKVDNKTGVLRW
jgi:hypothetical protein